jgi:hypothetical protein
MRKLMLVFIVLLLALFAPIHPAITQGQSTPDPVAVACGSAANPPDFLREVRAAASTAAVYQSTQDLLSLLRRLNRTIDPAKVTKLAVEVDQRIAELERIAQGPNAECRSTVFPALGFYYFARSRIRHVLGETEEVPQKQLQELVDSVYRAPTIELAYSRVFPMVFFLPSELPADPTPSEQVLCGERVSFATLGLTLNGSFFIRNNDSGGFPFRLIAGVLWEVAEENLLRSDRSLLQTLQDKAAHGCTPDLREIAASLVVKARYGMEGPFGII